MGIYDTGIAISAGSELFQNKIWGGKYQQL